METTNVIFVIFIWRYNYMQLKANDAIKNLGKRKE